MIEAKLLVLNDSRKNGFGEIEIFVSGLDPFFPSFEIPSDMNRSVQDQGEFALCDFLQKEYGFIPKYEVKGDVSIDLGVRSEPATFHATYVIVQGRKGFTDQDPKKLEAKVESLVKLNQDQLKKEEEFPFLEDINLRSTSSEAVQRVIINVEKVLTQEPIRIESVADSFDRKIRAERSNSFVDGGYKNLKLVEEDGKKKITFQYILYVRSNNLKKSIPPNQDPM